MEEVTSSLVDAFHRTKSPGSELLDEFKRAISYGLLDVINGFLKTEDMVALWLGRLHTNIFRAYSL